MRRFLGVAAILGILAVTAAQEAKAVRILGQGTDTCAIWLKARTGPEKNEYREWFLGYLSASAFLKNNDILRNMKYDDVLNRVLGACQNDPSKRLDDVLDSFFN